MDEVFRYSSKELNKTRASDMTAGARLNSPRVSTKGRIIRKSF